MDAFVERLIGKLDDVIAKLADVQARLLGVEKQMADHKRPCSFFEAHLAQHNEERQFYRSIIGYVISGGLLSFLLACAGAVLYAVNAGWLNH
jgi:hypothetical protein